MVSVGQPLDVAVTLPQRCGGCVSESCGPERASPSLLPLGLINLITQPFALAIFAAPHLKRSSPPVAGSASRLRKEFSGSFRIF